MNDFVIAVVGNPNCGKTTLFNALTGSRQRVGNWPGVTVERKTGEYIYEGKKIRVVDLPGIYSLTPASLDEAVARDYIFSGEADLIINIVDASNLERNLYLTVQLLEMHVSLILVLNMMDVAEERRMAIDIARLGNRLACPVIPMVASKGKGLRDLQSNISQWAGVASGSSFCVDYPPQIQDAIAALSPLVTAEALHLKLTPALTAMKLLEGDTLICRAMNARAITKRDACVKKMESELDEEPDIIFADSRYGMIHRIMRGVVEKKGQMGRTVTDAIDRVVLHRALGVPIFLSAMYLMFMVTINIGGAFIDFFDILAGHIFVEGFGAILSVTGTPEWLTALLAGGIGGGMQTLATFIPPIGFMFLCLCLLEDSGYMARAAFVMDRFMRVMGLPGKAFIPMLVGFGCNVPAIMATRTLENQRDRLLAVLMNPFMSCGARLPVYALFAAAFFPVGGQNVVFALYLIGIAFAALTGLVLKNTLLQGENTPFVMELPPYHVPTLKGVGIRVWERLKTFLFRAGKVILPVIVVLSFLNTLGTDGSMGNDNTDKSVLSAVGRAITPVFSPMGISRENWPAAVGVFTGIFAKEAVVGTLDALYARMEDTEGTEDEKPFAFLPGIIQAFAVIPANLAAVADSMLDPLGLSIGNVGSLATAAADQEVKTATFGAMVRLFDGRAGAFAYLLLILLYIPCAAAIAAIYRETNLGWAIFSCTWNGSVAYFAAVLFYQIATFSRHPATSWAWMGSIGGIFTGTFFLLRYMGRKENRPFPAVPDILRA